MLYAILFAAIQFGLASFELAGLQGRWVATEIKAVTFDCVVFRKPRQTRLEVTAGRYVLRIDGVPDEVGELAIHPAADPKGLDLRPAGERRPRQGIYALDGRTLRVALADRRPGWTSLGDNQGMIVITFRRAEKNSFSGFTGGWRQSGPFSYNVVGTNFGGSQSNGRTMGRGFIGFGFPSPRHCRGHRVPRRRMVSD